MIISYYWETLWPNGSALTSRLSDPGLNPGRGHCVPPFLGKIFSFDVPFSAQVYNWVPVNLMLGGNPAMDWHIPFSAGAQVLLVTSH